MNPNRAEQKGGVWRRENSQSLDLRDIIRFASSGEKPPLVFKNGRVINVFSGEIYQADIAVAGGFIVGVGEYSGRTEVDVTGKYLCPGLMDSHMHLESSMVTPGQLAQVVVPHGTTTIVTDPHEIANVCGAQGIRFILATTENLPLNVFVMLPSCVPATPLDDNGAALDAASLLPFYEHPRVLGLAEMMNYPGLLNGDPAVLHKLEDARRLNKVLDGHAPGLMGKELAGYIAAGVNSDHECTTAEEALARIRLGQWVMLREGTAGKNLIDLLPVITPATSGRCLLVTDDCHPEDLLHSGHLDHLMRILMRNGIDPVTAIQLATINPARYFGLDRLGALAPGYRADLLVLNNLTEFEVETVYKDGRIAAKNGRSIFPAEPVTDPLVCQTFAMPEVTPDMLKCELKSARVRVIGIIPGQIVTKELFLNIPDARDGVCSDPNQDILKAAVIERHRHTGKIGIGPVHGYGLKRGAVASSIAHDSHNLLVIGTNDLDMCLAANAVRNNQGGLAVAAGGRLLGELPLPIAGLMTPASVLEVGQKMEKLKGLARELGVNSEIDPFMTLSFLSLPVIPELKLTPRGLVSVKQQSIVEVSL